MVPSSRHGAASTWLALRLNKLALRSQSAPRPSAPLNRMTYANRETLFAAAVLAVVAMGVYFVTRRQLFAVSRRVFCFPLTGPIRDRITLSLSLGSLRLFAMDGLCVVFRSV